MVYTFRSSYDMHNAAHVMVILDIATSAWLSDFCQETIQPCGLRGHLRNFTADTYDAARIMMILDIAKSAQFIGRSVNKSTMQFSPFENEVRPGDVHTLQEFLFAEVKIFV